MGNNEMSASEIAAAKQKNVDDWLPITSSRNAKWWYSAFHNVTAMVGAGVLSLPYAMSNLGWYHFFEYDISISPFLLQIHDLI